MPNLPPAPISQLPCMGCSSSSVPHYCACSPPPASRSTLLPPSPSPAAAAATNPSPIPLCGAEHPNTGGLDLIYNRLRSKGMRLGFGHFGVGVRSE